MLAPCNFLDSRPNSVLRETLAIPLRRIPVPIPATTRMKNVARIGNFILLGRIRV